MCPSIRCGPTLHNVYIIYNSKNENNFVNIFVLKLHAVFALIDRCFNLKLTIGIIGAEFFRGG